MTQVLPSRNLSVLQASQLVLAAAVHSLHSVWQALQVLLVTSSKKPEGHSVKHYPLWRNLFPEHFKQSVL